MGKELQLWTQLERLRGYLVNLTGSYEEARELMQETALRALEKKVNYDLPLLSTMAKNIYLNQVRRKGVIEYVESYPYWMEANQQPNNLHIEDMERALNHSKTNGRAFLLYYRGYSYEEVAKIEGVKVGTIKSRIFSARQYAKKHLNS